MGKTGDVRLGDGPTQPPAPSGDDRTELPSGDAAAHPSARVLRGKQHDFDELLAVDPAHYVVGEEIARGGMGRIVTARDRRLGRHVAIKELLQASPQLHARFVREARITARLSHPGIVHIIEAGTWPNGEPFYVMRLVTGTSFDKSIAACTSLDTRLALLPHVIAAADALAYAHTERIIHRDLKPSNIMIGEFGETVVIDWGLAKDLSDAEPASTETDPYRARIAAPDQTVDGDVLGTPAYMPREQANGEAVDERGDVYALGAILYHLLAGKAPFSGATSHAILAAVLTEVPEPIEKRVPGAPRDLVAIVHKAMSTDKQYRYANAKELVDDLKKFQTGQLVGARHYSRAQLVRRWLRRHRAMVTLGAVALTVVAAVTAFSFRNIVREKERTEQQRVLAAKGRGQAQELLRFMVSDLRDKLAKVGKLDILDAVTNKAIAYYADQTGELDPAEQRGRAVAIMNLGQLLLDRGNLAGAMQQQRLAQLMLVELLTADPTSLDRLRDVSATHERIGELLEKAGDTARAADEYRASLDIREHLVAKAPDNQGWKRDLAIAYQHMSLQAKARGDVPSAVEYMKKSLDGFMQLAASNPTDARAQRELFITEQLTADTSRIAGHLDEALKMYDAATKIGEALSTAEPDNAQRQYDLQWCYGSTADVQLAKGDVAGALKSIRRQIAVANQLTARDAENAEWQWVLSLAHEKLSNALRDAGDPSALDEARSCVAIRDRLVAKDPSNVAWKRDLAVAHLAVANALNVQHAFDRAQQEFDLARTGYEKVVASNPENTSWRRELGVVYSVSAKNLEESGHVTSALELHRKKLALVEEAARAHPGDAELDLDVGEAHAFLSGALVKQRQAAEATAEARAGLAIFEKLLVQLPSSAPIGEDRAVTHKLLGDALLAANDVAAAVAEYRTARDQLEPIVAAAPDSVTWQTDLADLYHAHTAALEAAHDAAGARAARDAEISLREKLVKTHPDNRELKEALDVARGSVARREASASR